jgi:hypothetical protein
LEESGEEKLFLVENKNNFFEPKNKKVVKKPQKTPFLAPPQKKGPKQGVPWDPQK